MAVRQTAQEKLDALDLLLHRCLHPKDQAVRPPLGSNAHRAFRPLLPAGKPEGSAFQDAARFRFPDRESVRRQSVDIFQSHNLDAEGISSHTADRIPHIVAVEMQRPYLVLFIK